MGRKRWKRWNSCLMWFAASFSALCLTVSRSHAADGNTEESIPINEHVEDIISSLQGDHGGLDRKLILVSTLDGKISALDVKEEGQLLWSISADSRPLLSSSISKLEIMHDGVPTRYIPSLDGGLYRYDGESIEAVPMTADTLLSSTFKLADNTMMIGGKDIVTYGLDPITGKVRYACGVKGCRTFGEQVLNEEDLLVVNRKTQTVRAVDSRTGSEKWNFSVGEHELNFIKGQRHVISSEQEKPTDETDDVTCSLEDEDEFSIDDMEKFTSSVKIIVPEGMIVGVNPENMQSVTWQYKFKSPVSNVWLLYQGELRRLDMFGNNNIPALSSFDPGEQPIHPPLLYVGLHDKQLYVQPSDQMQERMTEASDSFTRDQLPGTCQRDGYHLPRVTWKPYLNTAQWRTPSMNNQPPQITSVPSHQGMERCEEGDNALVIWHENYPFDNGFYLYPEFMVPVPVTDEEWNQSWQNAESSMYEEVMTVQTTVWKWWKEVVAINVLISVLVHMVLTRCRRSHAVDAPSITSSQSNSESVTAQGLEVKDTESDNTSSTPPSRQNSDKYISRYAADFDHIEVLGKGGFGVVFEATNKVDECHYAIKRIALPNSDGAKEKVMREVKALAKLDHVGIVRFFHAWIESPPPGWQEERDQLLECSDGVTSPSMISQFTKYPTEGNKCSPPKSDFGHERSLYGNTSLNRSPSGKPSPFDALKNPFGQNHLEVSELDIKRGGSEEFSVHNVSESKWDVDENNSMSFSGGVQIPGIYDHDDESGSFSYGVGTPNSAAVKMDDSVEIEFRLSDDEDNLNNNSLSGLDKSISLEQTDHIIPLEETNSSFRIVFEDSGCGEKSSKESSEGTDHFEIQNPFQKLHSSCSGKCRFSSSLGSKCCCNKNRSKTHSRSNSKDLANLTIEKETKDLTKHDKVSSCNTDKAHKPKLFLYIQMQLCKRETLKDWLASNTLNRDRHMVLDMFDQIVSAIEYVHDCGLMHRDLKPSNIFFSLDGVIKMGDFGLVTAQPEEQNEGFCGGNPHKKHTAQVGTQLYMSPEQTSGKVYTQKVDIFSLGVILFELLYPFATQMERVNTLVKVRQQILPERFTREMHTEAEFVKLLLSPSPDGRPSAKEILADDLLKDFENRRIPRRFRTRTVSQNSS